MTRPIDHAKPDKLLVSRRDAAAMLGNVSTQTMIRLERIGRIKAVRLDPSKKTAPAFYRMADVLALTRGTAK